MYNFLSWSKTEQQFVAIDTFLQSNEHILSYFLILNQLKFVQHLDFFIRNLFCSCLELHTWTVPYCNGPTAISSTLMLVYEKLDPSLFEYLKYMKRLISLTFQNLNLFEHKNPAICFRSLLNSSALWNCKVRKSMCLLLGGQPWGI